MPEEQDQLQLPEVPSFGTAEPDPLPPPEEPAIERGVVELDFSVDKIEGALAQLDEHLEEHLSEHIDAEIESTPTVDELKTKIVEHEASLVKISDEHDRLISNFSTLSNEHDNLQDAHRLAISANRALVEDQGRLVDERDQLKTELALEKLETLKRGDEIAQLREALASLSRSKLYMLYPKAPRAPRTFVLAEDYSKALEKFAASGGDHESISQVTVVADKLMI